MAHSSTPPSRGQKQEQQLQRHHLQQRRQQRPLTPLPTAVLVCMVVLLRASHAKLVVRPADEETIGVEPPCLKCDGGAACVLEYGQCDGSTDCKDGADESLELCAASSFNCSTTGRVECPPVQSLLPMPLQCIASWQMCDGTTNCAGGTDEADTTCSTFDCKADGRVSCPSGKAGCLWSSSLCDGKADCIDGSDEWPDYCRSFNCTASDRVMCPGGEHCTTRWSLCDGNPDCGKDGSDESPGFCGDFDCASVDKVRCPTLPWLRVKPQCVFTSELCEGTPNCPGGADEDEAFCATHECSEGTVKCREKGRTLCKEGSYCNGQVDCAEDGSDEEASFCASYSCPDGMVKCGDGLQCVYASQQCNNVAECKDGSDEAKMLCDKSFDCSATSRVTCPSGRYCMDNFCNVCNNGTAPPSCPDESDQLESSCYLRNDTECSFVYNGCFSDKSGMTICAKSGVSRGGGGGDDGYEEDVDLPLASAAGGGKGGNGGEGEGGGGGDVVASDAEEDDNDANEESDTALSNEGKGKKTGKGKKMDKGKKTKKGKKGKKRNRGKNGADVPGKKTNIESMGG